MCSALAHRPDRIENKQIQLCNFWPTEDLDEYNNLSSASGVQDGADGHFRHREENLIEVERGPGDERPGLSKVAACKMKWWT